MGGYVGDPSVEISNSVFSGDFVALSVGAATTVRNCVFAGTTGDRVIDVFPYPLTIDSSIFLGNAGEIGRDGTEDDDADATVRYSTFSGNGGGWLGADLPIGVDGNLGDDPLFSAWVDDGDPATDDFTLRAGSPAIDAGDPSSGRADLDGTRNDMGVFGGPNGSW